jgi:predicted lipid-binding transport protein (Tim44 family)
MNPQSDQDLERRLQELDADVSSSRPPVNQPKQPTQPSESTFQPMQTQVNRFLNWFNGLSGVGKLVVGGVAALVTIAIVQALLKLVASAIAMALLAGLVYFGYKFFVARSSQNKN